MTNTTKLNRSCDDCDRRFADDHEVFASIEHGIEMTENGWAIRFGCEGFDHENRGKWS